MRLTYPSWADQVAAWNEFTKGSFGGQWTAPMIGPETPTFMGLPHAKGPEELEGKDAVIIGAPYVASSTEKYAGVDRMEWLAAPQRVRQQSIRYQSGYIQDFDLDVFEYIDAVDYGDACIPGEILDDQSPESILRAQSAVEEKVGHALDAGGVPIVIGQNSPCGSYAIAKPIAERASGPVGCISLDTHWDAQPLDHLTGDPRIAGSASWKEKMYEFHDNMSPRHLVEIGERGMLEKKDIVRKYLRSGARFISSWELRTSLGIEGVIGELDRAYDGTEGVYAHFDMDVMGGAGPAPGDILGEAVEPIALTDYEIIRIAHEIGKRGLRGMSFICIPPGSAVTYRVVVYVIMYMLAGLAMQRMS